ncbi:hypothetical protein V5F32_00970 [Xanthobacter oligotrophicus]|uniref:Uncharacterized protein n=1 Tax=Xanthobacter oligotrophicus TaxID=2607286 RepID=A0ABW6ZPT5_9HYPH
MSESKQTPHLPAPRLQFRWAPGETPGYEWVVFYEFVLPLREHDCRRDGPQGASGELVLEIGKTARGSNQTCPNDKPYRDGAHANWDNEALGGYLPIIVIDPQGRPFVEELYREANDPPGWTPRSRMVPFVTADTPKAEA